jgi:hypothetical protein
MCVRPATATICVIDLSRDLVIPVISAYVMVSNIMNTFVSVHRYCNYQKNTGR